MNGRTIRIKLGLAVPYDGVMHVTWARRLLDRLGATTTARALGIGCVPDRVLRQWDKERETYAKRAFEDALGELAKVSGRRAAQVVRDRHRAVSW